MAAAASLIAGWQTGQYCDASILDSVYSEAATLAATPLIGTPESADHKLEQLCKIVGKLIETLIPIIPATNVSTHNLTTVAIHVAAIESRIEATIANMQARTQYLEQQATPTSNKPYSKTAAESRAMRSIKPLVSDKKEFRLWHNKCINAITQIHRDSRLFFDEIITYLDAHRIPLDDAANLLIAEKDKDQANPINVSRLNEDLFYILMDKCEGEAANRVLSVPKGSGIHAYQNIYLWFAGQSGMAISKRIEWVMRPPIPRDDHELA